MAQDKTAGGCCGRNPPGARKTVKGASTVPKSKSPARCRAGLWQLLSENKLFLRHGCGGLDCCPAPSESVNVMAAHSQISPANLLAWEHGGKPTFPGLALSTHQPQCPGGTPKEAATEPQGPYRNPSWHTPNAEETCTENHQAHMSALVCDCPQLAILYLHPC